ncbi:MAG: Rieske 2Fe-2S domain-containing protein [Gammaproteobacteria bacterium]|jgi:nitrite reductase/ring-hydroxylating ferredoxin subunit
MSQAAKRKPAGAGDWRKLAPLEALDRRPALMQRVAGRQIAVFKTPAGIRACENRCPHEGYPLSEGSLSADCILTCNWHNWKFDLDSGDNLYGGDRLRIYATEIRGDEIWVDLTEPPYEERYEEIVGNLRDAFDDYSYDRVAREIARLDNLGADPLDALRLAIDWSWQRMEFGWTHAYAGMADWLALYDEHAGDAELRLVCLVEGVTHAAYDVLRERDYPFTDDSRDFDTDEFVAAIEAEDEAAAAAAIRGGIRAGLGFADFEGALTRAALLHYNDFGHSLIYVTKAGALIERLGDRVAEPLLLSLVRALVYARREDRIPEFRGYARQLEKWGRGSGQPAPELWRRKGIDKSLQAAVDCSGSDPQAIYRALLLANAVNLLGFDIAQQDRIHVPVSGNVGWLDFTHGLTFANAVHGQCSRFPELWPQGLLQMACFNGRNAAYTEADIDIEGRRLEDPGAAVDELLLRVLDHGQGEHIVAVHLLKTALAVREEIGGLEAADAGILAAALKRFFESPIKRRQARRVAYQSLQFVAKTR